MTHYPDTCIHQPAGLCPDCRRDADEDPEAWTEYGRHADGLRRFAELQAEMAAEIEKNTGSVPESYSRGDCGDDIPY